MTHHKINADTALTEIPLPFMDVVLTERFLLPPDSFKRFQMPLPKTVFDVSEVSGLPVGRVVEILNECVDLNQKIWLQIPLDEAAAQDRTWIVDMRPMVDYDVDPLHPAARIFHHGNQAHQLELMRTLDKVIVLSATDAHAWSATMALRQMGVNAFLCTKN